MNVQQIFSKSPISNKKMTLPACESIVDISTKDRKDYFKAIHNIELARDGKDGRLSNLTNYLKLKLDFLVMGKDNIDMFIKKQKLNTQSLISELKK